MTNGVLLFKASANAFSNSSWAVSYTHLVPLTDEAIATALDSDAVLMGSIGGNTATSPW